jgi:hypothetical protein
MAGKKRFTCSTQKTKNGPAAFLKNAGNKIKHIAFEKSCEKGSDLGARLFGCASISSSKIRIRFRTVESFSLGDLGRDRKRPISFVQRHLTEITCYPNPAFALQNKLLIESVPGLPLLLKR